MTPFSLLVFAVVLGIVGWPFWWLIADGRNRRRKLRAAIEAAQRYVAGRTEMGKHDEDHDQAVTVAELLKRAAEEGEPLRLNWSTADTTPHGLAAVPEDADWPTGVLLRVEDNMPDAQTTAPEHDTGSSLPKPLPLPKRVPGPIPEPSSPAYGSEDTAMMERVLRELRGL